MMDTGAGHSVVTQPVCLLSQKHTTIVRATGDWANHPFLLSRQCSLGSHEVRHEFLYLPYCPVGLISRELLCKLKAQVTFDFDGTTALKLRGPEAKTLILTVTQEEEWWLYATEGSPPEIPELPFKNPGVWIEDNPLGLV
jgi:hypothetical protein